ncbi:hypothetical protein BLD44_020435 [Mastigocladus laminosus UU774]|nr:hypothetical protein BLD44_020435 [Mastigocladus laminosus UU774]
MSPCTQVFDYAPTVELLRSFLPSKAVLSEEDAFKKTWRIYIYLKTIYGNGITLGQNKYINSPLAFKDTNSQFSFFEWLIQLEICLWDQFPKLSNNLQTKKEWSRKQKKEQQREQAKENLELLQKVTIEDI